MRVGPPCCQLERRWRLVRRYREGSREYARVARLVREGEWTTPGDVSIAARGDTRAADSIARAGVSDRICDDGDPAMRVTWDELQRRNAERTTRRGQMKGTMNYIQIPSTDLDTSCTFYEEVFGWTIWRHPAVGDIGEQTSYPEFFGPEGSAGGGFVLGMAPAREPGLLPNIHVASIDETLRAVAEHGGEVVQPRTAIVEGKDWTARFRDPSGNLMALFEAFG